MKNIITQLTETILILLELTAAAAAADVGFQKKMFRLEKT